MHPPKHASFGRIQHIEPWNFKQQTNTANQSNVYLLIPFEQGGEHQTALSISMATGKRGKAMFPYLRPAVQKTTDATRTEQLVVVGPGRRASPSQAAPHRRPRLCRGSANRPYHGMAAGGNRAAAVGTCLSRARHVSGRRSVRGAIAPGGAPTPALV